MKEDEKYFYHLSYLIAVIYNRYSESDTFMISYVFGIYNI